MTSAKELGITYSAGSDLINPAGELKLNAAGAKFIGTYAHIFGYSVGEIEEGYEVKKITWGVNGAMVGLVIPTADGRECVVNVSMDSDYFLP